MSGVLFIVCVPRAEYEKSITTREPIVTTDTKEVNSQTCGISKSKSNECIHSYDNPDVNCRKLFKCKSDLNVLNEVKRSSSHSELDKVTDSSVGKKRKNSTLDERIPPFDPHTPLEKILSELLDRLHVKDAVWCLGKEKKYYQVFFSVESGVLCEEAIHLLASFGIGTRYNSVVSVIPCALYYRGKAKDAPVDDTAPPTRHGPSAWSTFVSSVRSRTTLAQLLQDVRADASLTFDWLFLLIVAAFLSAIGLVENSTVFLVASMLISPLMGPIMACAVGTAVKDASLQRMGLLHELFGLFLALVIGFLFGLMICALGENYSDEVWPTLEMISRCEVRSLWVGVLVALPSAAAVSLAVLGGYTASLVGVAISASLLPPAVNAGLLWAMALTSLVSEENASRWDLNNSTVYSDNRSVEIAAHGGVSICLTIVNILCIYVGGVIVYKIKEVAPMDPKNMRFWRSECAGDPCDVADQAGSGGTTLVNNPGPALIAWDYLRCSSTAERMRLSRLASGYKYHDTWSPYTAVSPCPPPLARDVEAYWNSEATSVEKSRFTRRQSPNVRSSQGYTQLPSEDCLPADREDSGASCSLKMDPANVAIERERTSEKMENSAKNKKIKKTKFTVTPVFDPIYD